MKILKKKKFKKIYYNKQDAYLKNTDQVRNRSNCNWFTVLHSEMSRVVIVDSRDNSLYELQKYQQIPRSDEESENSQGSFIISDVEFSCSI